MTVYMLDRPGIPDAQLIAYGNDILNGYPRGARNIPICKCSDMNCGPESEVCHTVAQPIDSERK